MNGFHGKNIMNGKRTGESMKTKPSGQFNPSIKSLLSFILAFSLILISIAPALIAPVYVYAAGSVGTLKAFLIGLSAVMGVGNIDPSSISYMNNNTVLSAPLEDFVGDNPIYTVQDINQALAGNEGVARWTSGFSNNAAQVKVAQQYISSSGGDPSGLNNLGGASAGENLISSARYGYNNYKTNGNFDLKPSIGGQTMTDAIDATAIMTAMSNYAYNFDKYMQYANNANLTEEERNELWDQGLVFADQNQIEDYLQNRNKTINNGTSIDSPNSSVNNYFLNGNTGICICYTADSSSRWSRIYYGSGDCAFVYYSVGNNEYIASFVGRNNTDSYVVKNSIINDDGSINSKTFSNTRTGIHNVLSRNITEIVNLSGFTYLGTRNDYDEFVNKYQKGEIDIKKYSPSLIGNDGQLSGTSETDPVTNQPVYNINVSPNNTYITNNYGIPSDENINTFYEDINEAINQGETQENIGLIFQNFVNSFTNTMPAPTAAPVVPDQPVPDPKPTGTPEQQAENMEIMATPQLKDKFPFCIPWDVYYAFAVLEDQREAPSFDFELDLGPAGSHHIEIDFSEWEDIASLLRLLELLAFIIGLAIATKQLMGGTGA